MPLTADPASAPPAAALIVEDQPFAGMVASDILAEAGLATFHANDAPSALALLRSHPEIELVVTAADLAGPGGEDDELRALPSPDHVLVLVAGGGGLYSSVFPSWSAGAHANPILHERIETDQACVIPGLG